MERRGQVLVGFKCDAAFKRELDQAANADGVALSQLVRDAVYEKLETLGYKIPETLRVAPSRSGKGGPKTIINHGIQQTGSNPSAKIINHAPQKSRHPAKRKRKPSSSK